METFSLLRPSLFPKHHPRQQWIIASWKSNQGFKVFHIKNRKTEEGDNNYVSKSFLEQMPACEKYFSINILSVLYFSLF